MRSDDDFRANLALGRRWEKAVAGWLQSRGWFLLPVYDYSGEDGNKAPKLHGANGGVVVPDLLAAHPRRNAKWVEVKYRNHAVEFRRDRTIVTGKVPWRHWNHYLRTEQLTGIPVWLVFVQDVESEIVGGPIKALAQHLRPGVGHGAREVNFPYSCLTRLAPLSAVQRYFELAAA